MQRKIIKTRPLPSRSGLMEAEIVLAELPGNKATPWVTWQRNLDDGSTYWGHYFSNYGEAVEDFNNRGR